MKEQGPISAITTARIGSLILLSALFHYSSGSISVAAEKKGALDDFMIKNGYEVVNLIGDNRTAQHIYGTLNGKRTKMALASMTPQTMVDNSLTRGLEPVERKDAKIRGLFEDLDRGEMRVVIVEHLEAGSVVFKPQPMAAYNLHSGKSAKTGSNIGTAQKSTSRIITDWDLLLGMDFFRSNHAILHLAGNKLFVRKEKPNSAVAASVKASLLASGWIEAPISPSADSRLFLSADINGKPARMLVSTSDFYSILDQRQLANFGSSTREVLVQFKRGKDQPANFNTSRIRFIKLGDAELDDVSIGVVDLKHENDDEVASGLPPMQGIVGDDFLAQWIALIDFSEPAVYLRKGVIKVGR